MNDINTSEDKTLKEFIEKLVNNQEDLPPEFAKVIDEHFWELLEE